MSIRSQPGDVAPWLSGNADYIESLYAEFQRHPEKMPLGWKEVFESYIQPTPVNQEQSWAFNGRDVADHLASGGQDLAQAVRDSVRARMLVLAYRERGHRAAHLDPLGLAEQPPLPELDPASYGFTEADLDRPVVMDGELGMDRASIGQLVALLRERYCCHLGVQFMHISDPVEKDWIQKRIEGQQGAVAFTNTGRTAILKKLIEVETFERFLHRRYPGTKRFGIDGAESMVPALEQIIKRGGNLGVEEIVIGMPHRGRLNVLGAVMGKPYHVIFNEFEGGTTHGAGEFGSGDVKYHLGTSTDRAFDGRNVHISLSANPSHLEAIDPVVIGKARGKQQERIAKANGDDTREAWRGTVLPLLLHGDAAFAGQGVVSECLALSGLAGYRTGGTMHFIVNNQIGFTTSPHYSRSSPYPSDVALQVQTPIFHVNGDDPEAVVHATRIATEYRQAFGKNVVIDMFCYRRYGHNEGDEPMFTQPLMYKTISGHPTTREIYARRLREDGVVSKEEESRLIANTAEFLDSEFTCAKSFSARSADWLAGKWAGKSVADDGDRRGHTGVDTGTLADLGRRVTDIPAHIDAHKTVRRIYGARGRAIAAGENIDWTTAEMLAFASLLDEGFDVRLSGQDSARGTFSQRHSRVVDQATGKKFTPLGTIDSARYEVIDSPLSEEAVVGFEYGYSLVAPDTLTMWEAQFGDFANGAQVFFDQFLSCGERKWLRMSGLVCLLPHGYEGQGPEHSSARLERFLQLCGQDNMQIANCTTPANYFHILRRQIHRDFRKPLILMTPKSLLRHKLCVSAIGDFGSRTSFHRILWDDADERLGRGGPELVADKKIRKVFLCSGKVYYDLVAEREKRRINDIYIMRMEQLYPFPVAPLIQELERFETAQIVWVQEEPKNMGAWTFVDVSLERVFARLGYAQSRPVYVGRPASAATAAGSKDVHDRELAAMLDDAFST